MSSVDQQLTAMFRERADAARPDPDLPAVLEGTQRLRVVAHQTQRARPWQRVLGIAAAVIIAAGASVAVERQRASDNTPGSDRSKITYPDQVPDAPLSPPGAAPPFGAVRASPDGTGLVVRRNSDTVPLDDGAQTPEGSPWSTWPIGAQTVVDVDNTSPAATYIATCCEPSGTIWRNGEEHTTGTRIDYLLDGVLPATVDPATSTARVGGLVLHEPGVLDVSVLDRRSAVLLVDEPSPRLIVISSDDFTATADPGRRTIELPEGTDKPCGIVALEQGILVLAGEPIGIDPCVSDRAFIIDPETGVVISAIRLPEPIRAINSDHLVSVIAVTLQGDVLLGLLGASATDASWTTVLEGDYLAAYLL